VILDLADAGARDLPTDFEADLCIIGAGAAGLTIATALESRARSRGLRILVIESGGFEHDPDTQFLAQGFIAKQPLELAGTRLRRFGGSTQHWNGVCRPLRPVDLRARAWIANSGWPLEWDELEAHYPRACEILGLGAYDFAPENNPHEHGPALELPEDSPIRAVVYRMSPPVRLGDDLRARVGASTSITVLVNANVTELVPGERGEAAPAGSDATGDAGARPMRLVRVASLPREGAPSRGATVRAGRFVLACGGIENPRLMLLSRSVEPMGVGNANDLVGRYFHEHPHMDRAGKAVCFGTWWRAYATRDTSKPVALRHALCVSVHGQRSGGVSGIAFMLTLDPRLEPPARGPVELDVMTMAEQEPRRDSRVTLAEDMPPDALGQPRVRLAWPVGARDLETIRAGLRLLAGELGSRGLALLREGAALAADRFPHHEDVYPGGHHMGTTRMSADPALGVVDATCRVHGYSNLYVAGGSVFPTGGFSNPTLTIVALALRLAAHLGERMGR
jgi:choline dehydrogenase-like flavoprotein